MPRLLLLAQLPPPVHGVTVVSKAVLDLVSEDGSWRVSHYWQGGASALSDIGVMRIAKLTEFGRLVVRLLLLRLRGKRFDAVYLTLAPWTRAALRDAVLAALGKNLSDRTLVHVHGEGLDQILSGKTARMRLLRRLLSGCELIAVTSTTVALAHGSSTFCRVWHLPNFVYDAVPAVRDAPRRPLRIGFLGNLDPRKGVLRFASAIAALRASGVETRATIAGPQTPHLSYDALANALAQLGIADCVDVVGPKFDHDKTAFLAELDAFLYLTEHDHAPLVVLEAMAAGAVPIVSDHAGVPELLGPELFSNVVPVHLSEADRNAVIVSIVRGYLQGNALQAARDAARERVLENYTLEQFRARLHEILEGAGASARRPAIEGATVTGPFCRQASGPNA